MVFRGTGPIARVGVIVPLNNVMALSPYTLPMPKQSTLRDGRKIRLNTPTEDARITAAARSDPDAKPLTAAQLKAMRPMGRPRLESPKASLSMRIDADVLEALRASGAGWQTRVNSLLRNAVARGRV